MKENNDSIVKKTINLESDHEASLLFGSHDRYLHLIRDTLGIKIVARNGIIRLEGEEPQVKKGFQVFNHLLRIVRLHGRLRTEEVERALKDIEEKTTEETPSPQEIDVFIKGVHVRPLTEGQTKYVEAIRTHDLIFCIGPAGTGKTYLAVAMALSALKSGTLKKIVLARPAIEAGEKLGYLPGDIQAKVNPYLRPLYDALEDMLDIPHVKKYIENDLIEILPLAYMRGRTLNDAFIILDEAQNCTVRQMKTFLTRLGVKAKVVVTGDITQIDLPHGELSGLIDVQERLIHIKGVAFISLARKDIVRHRLVQDIVDAYTSKE